MPLFISILSLSLARQGLPCEPSCGSGPSPPMPSAHRRAKRGVRFRRCARAAASRQSRSSASSERSTPASAASSGEVLRKHGLYHSHLVSWRDQLPLRGRDRMAAQKTGPKPLRDAKEEPIAERSSTAGSWPTSGCRAPSGSRRETSRRSWRRPRARPRPELPYEGSSMGRDGRFPASAGAPNAAPVAADL
jgi:hypothetical protein